MEGASADCYDKGVSATTGHIWHSQSGTSVGLQVVGRRAHSVLSKQAASRYSTVANCYLTLRQIVDD